MALRVGKSHHLSSFATNVCPQQVYSSGIDKARGDGEEGKQGHDETC